MDAWLPALLIALVAFAYALVGHGGASGYLAVMALIGTAPEVMRPTALVLNIFVSGFAFYQFHRAGHFRWRLFWPFALLSVPFAFIGSGFILEDPWYHRVLAVCLVVAALRMLGLFKPSQRATRDAPLLLAVPIGAAIGLVAGMLGIGGGVLLSPLLLVCAWADAKTAAATSAFFIFVNSAAGLIRVQPIGGMFTSDMFLWTAVAVGAGLLGSWVGARKAPEPRLRQALGAILLLASVKLCWP